MRPLETNRRRALAPLLLLVLAALLAACSDVNVPIGAPHQLGGDLLVKGREGFHGTAENDCSECHEVASFCYQCHFGPGGRRVPQGSNYLHGTFPHDLPELTSVGEVCDRCHSISSHYRGTPVSCHLCHQEPSLPHPMGREWLISDGAQFHGRPDVLNLVACSSCHEVETFCSTCHFGTSGSRVPPDVTWTHGWPSHTQADLVTAGAVCVKCHELTKLYRDVPGMTNCTGCHDGTYTQHSLPFFNDHPPAAKANLKACQQCHGQPGTSFEGGVAKVACSTCHTAAKAHPTSWAVGHRNSGNLETACTLCHDVIPGRTAPLDSAPSCFSESFTNASGEAATCHPAGWLPHQLPFTDPSLHGPEAKANLAYCQQCHGVPGTINFSGGSAGVSCAGCHTAAHAHPTDWQGAGTYSHRTAQNTGTACTLCHDVVQGRARPDPNAPSCFSSSFTNAAGQTRACHAGGPGVPHAPAAQFRAPSAHGPEAKKDLTYCQTCHGQPGTSNFSGGSARACTDCHAPARAHPTDWQGAGTYSHRDAGNRTAACGLCHNVTGTGAGPLSGAPSCFSSTFTNPLGQTRPCHQGGPGIPHAPPAQFIAPTAHGPVAKQDLLYCQKCHGQPGTTLFQGGSATGCATCHTAAKAHATDWQGSGTYSHRNAQNMATACAACHDYTQGRTAPFPGAPSCYSSNFTNALGQARSCHPGGPGSVHPMGQPWLDKKSSQFHGDSNLVCANCHTVATFCSTCHFGPSGSRVPPGTSWTHGRRNHDNYRSYQTVCNACHNVNRTYGNPPAACHNCH